MPTIEGQTVMATVPQDVTGVGPGSAALRMLRALPSPAFAGTSVRFTAGPGAAGTLDVYERLARWALRDLRGRPVRPGVYVARAPDGAHARVVVLSR